LLCSTDPSRHSHSTSVTLTMYMYDDELDKFTIRNIFD